MQQMHFAGWVLIALSLFAAGCGSSPPELKKAPVKGTVQLDSKPMTEGEISFAIVGEPPVVIPVVNGAYTGEAPVGPTRVEVRAYRQGTPVMMGDQQFGGDKENYLPAQYNLQTTLKADVSAAGPNEFNFEVTSK
ncbi:MAG: hypothetical protein MUF06_10775 [Pirellulaceae bacterium]|nr:hypothetical protein [Pirellulaceae bacterium]